jgi:hypothetical protein
MWPTVSMPAPRPRELRTNPRRCGIQPADKSLQIVVSGALPPALRNNYKGECITKLKRVRRSVDRGVSGQRITDVTHSLSVDTQP